MYGISKKKWNKTLIYHGFEFWQQRVKKDGNIIWRCTQNQVLKCKATIEAAGNNVVSGVVEEHKHEGNVGTALAKLGTMKKKKKQRPHPIQVQFEQVEYRHKQRSL